MKKQKEYIENHDGWVRIFGKSQKHCFQESGQITTQGDKMNG